MATWDDGPPTKPIALRLPPTSVAVAAVAVFGAVVMAGAYPQIWRAQQAPDSPDPVSSVSWAHVVVFGAALSYDAADRQATLVRSKGYLAHVIVNPPSGGGISPTFRVISRPYDSRVEAEFWAGIFAEIGIPGKQVVWTTVQP